MSEVSDGFGLERAGTAAVLLQGLLWFLNPSVLAVDSYTILQKSLV